MVITKLIQVTNISPAISEEQMLTLFGFVGKIEAMCMYPSIQALEISPDTPKICYIKFFDATCVGVSQYLTNTVFNDRALVVTPVEDGLIPDEEKAKEMAARVGLPPAVNKPPDKPKTEIVNFLEGMPPNQVIVSHDPHLEEQGLPKYPPLPASFEGSVIEEIRRTVLIIDISESVTSDELIQFFEKAGDIKYMKFCSRNDNIRYALMEFTEQPHVIEALKMNGQKLKDKVMKVYHSTQAITKPETKSNEVAQREVVEALTRVKEAESLISAAIDPLLNLSKSKKGRSRSRSPRKSRRRSRSRSRRRSRSHSRRRRGKSRSRRSRSRRSRSRSHHRRQKSNSPRRHRKSRSRSPRSKRKSRSKSPQSKRKSRSKSPNHSKRKSRSKSPNHSKRKSRSKSPNRSKRKSRSKSPSKLKRKSRSRSPRSKRKSRSRSPRSKHRSSSKSETFLKLSNSGSSSKNLEKSPDRRSKSDSYKHKDRERDDIYKERKYIDSRRRSEKDDRAPRFKDQKKGKENANYSSQSKEETPSHKSSLVKENGSREPHKQEMNFGSESKTSLLKHLTESDDCVDSKQYTVLKGPNDECNLEHSNDVEEPVRSGSGSRSRTNSPSGSVSSHSLPNLADCHTRSCSPVDPL